MSDEPEKAETKEEPPPKKKAAWRLKLEALVAEYGTAAFVTWFLVFGLTWLGFFTAISLGFEVDSGGEGTGAVAIAYIATQLTKPIRIAVVVFLTPIVVKVWHRFLAPIIMPIWHRFFPPKDEEEEDDEEDDDEEEDDDDDEDDDAKDKPTEARV